VERPGAQLPATAVPVERPAGEGLGGQLPARAATVERRARERPGAELPATAVPGAVEAAPAAEHGMRVRVRRRPGGRVHLT
jgi:hypothetical protein